MKFLTYKWPLALLFVIPFACLNASARAGEVSQVKILSAWGGLGKPERDELGITRKLGGYYARGKKIKEEFIKNLLSAVEAPAIGEFDLPNLGLTREWLNANAEPAVKEYAGSYYSAAAPNQRALYLSSFQNPDFIRKLLPSFYGGWWTDDYPRVEVEITYGDGSKIVVKSDEQQYYMLPWEVTKGGQTVRTYNADIARATAALLPKKFTNRDRMAGDGFRRELAEHVMREIKDEWELLDAENKAGKYLATLRQAYSVESAEVDGTHGVDFGKEWVNGSSFEDNLQATLKRKDLPGNFQIGIALPFKAGEVKGVDAFTRGADQYLDLALSVPWLKEYVSSNARVGFELRFVGDRSFSEKAMRIFADDMRLKGKESLVKEVEAVQKDVSLLAVGWKYYRDYWLVLPDKRVVLWRYNTHRTAPLKWETEGFVAWDCSNYQAKCVGAVISPDGKVGSK